ncbi:DNA polymerase V, partial [Klebsiella pneumoniae]
MPRHYEIDSAWRASIKREPNGRQTVTTCLL